MDTGSVQLGGDDRRQPANRTASCAIGSDGFEQAMDRWLDAFVPKPNEAIPGVPDWEFATIKCPALVIRGGEQDFDHPKRTRRGARVDQGFSDHRTAVARGRLGARGGRPNEAGIGEPVRSLGAGGARTARLHRRAVIPSSDRLRAKRSSIGHTGAVLLAEVVATSDAVGSTRARSTKIAALAELLGRLAPDEIEAAVGFLTGEARQGRIGVGWATVFRLDVTPAAVPTLTIADVDRALDQILVTTGSGSAAGRDADPARRARSGHDRRRPTSSGACSSASCARVRWPA